jgi:hypothetical protein
MLRSLADGAGKLAESEGKAVGSPTGPKRRRRLPRPAANADGALTYPSPCPVAIASVPIRLSYGSPDRGCRPIYLSALDGRRLPSRGAAVADGSNWNTGGPESQGPAPNGSPLEGRAEQQGLALEGALAAYFHSQARGQPRLSAGLPGTAFGRREVQRKGGGQRMQQPERGRWRRSPPASPQPTPPRCGEPLSDGPVERGEAIGVGAGRVAEVADPDGGVDEDKQGEEFTLAIL